MNELLKDTIRALVETVFQVVTGPGSHDEKAARIKRATLALSSETAAEALIREALKRPNTGT
jgi:hypothetical protein